MEEIMEVRIEGYKRPAWTFREKSDEAETGCELHSRAGMAGRRLL